ncbi:MAG: DUF4430 domain-containing protein [Clostridia bacterium]|nr:DUF4430 domain-containing protein [Clostridia bacterium]MBQ5487711.1 DUF4430 domain-containing protein [Clostridia bacterium]
MKPFFNITIKAFVRAGALLLACLLLVFAACAAPKPAEGKLHCTLEIECKTILDNMDDLNADKLEVLPEDGVLLKKCTVYFDEGDSVYDMLVRETRARGIHMEASYTPVYESAYIEGIGNLYEFDCGEGSGWMYSVNGEFPNYGTSKYELHDGDEVAFRYTCDFGADVGGLMGS